MGPLGQQEVMGGAAGGAGPIRVVLQSVMDLGVRKGLMEFLLQKAVETAAREATILQCGQPDQAAKVLLEQEELLARAGELLHGDGSKATKEDVRAALGKMGKQALAKRLDVHTRGRRAVAHPDPGLAKQIIQALQTGRHSSAWTKGGAEREPDGEVSPSQDNDVISEGDLELVAMAAEAADVDESDHRGGDCGGGAAHGPRGGQ